MADDPSVRFVAGRGRLGMIAVAAAFRAARRVRPRPPAPEHDDAALGEAERAVGLAGLSLAEAQIEHAKRAFARGEIGEDELERRVERLLHGQRVEGRC